MNETDVYDIAVIGGGIAGAGIAREAALRGIRTVLFEKNTFGSGTSSKSSKLIHGGLRYLETAWRALKRADLADFIKNVRFVFSSLKETHTLRKIAPDLVKPIRLLIPVYRQTHRSRWAVYLGALVYGFLSRITGGQKPAHILWTKKTVLQIVPALDPEGLVGGVLVWDHTTDDERLVKETIASAVRGGAEVFEHAPVTGCRFDEEKRSYEIKVTPAGSAKTFFARKVINASGPWVDRVRETFGERADKLLAPVAGSHITLKKFTDCSVILEAPDGRIFFVIDQRDRSRVGTTERVHADPDTVSASEEEVDYLVAALRKYFPAVDFRKEDILSRDAGVRPLAKPKTDLELHDISREHAFVTGPSGILHVLGVKLTDHRRAAEEIIDRLAPEIRSWNASIKPKSLTSSTAL